VGYEKEFCGDCGQMSGEGKQSLLRSSHFLLNLFNLFCDTHFGGFKLIIKCRKGIEVLVVS
jgi:hypothetical protein